jgi:ribosomal-protein-alanine N-acetyltransferase
VAEPLRAATSPEIERVRRTLVGSGLFADADDLIDQWSRAPWRVQLTPPGDIVVVRRWRAHLPVLAIEGMWAPEARMGAILEGLVRVALELGLERLLSPLVDLEQREPYLAAGFEPHTEIVGMRLVRLAERSLPSGRGVPRAGSPGDLETVLAIDEGSFDDFWRYDAGLLERYLRTDRLSVAESPDGPLGYSLSVIQQGEGVLGRIAVVPEARRCGVGDRLLADVLTHMARNGASAVSLCTQSDNEASRRLYASAGFLDTGRSSSLLLSSKL